MAETIIAVGNGGYNIATDLKNAGIFRDAQFIVCDTSEKDLEKNSARADKSFLLERLRCKVKSHLTSLVKNVVEDTNDNIIVIASFGGMTGSKYAPLIALEALKEGKHVTSIVSMPFAFEGEAHRNRSLDAKMQIIAASNFTLFQFNEKLQGGLGMAEMNAPIMETMKNLLEGHTLQELDTIRDANDLVSKEYRTDYDISLIWLRTDCYPWMGPEKRAMLINGKEVY